MNEVNETVLIDRLVAAKLVEDIASSPTLVSKTFMCAGRQVTRNTSRMTTELQELFFACEWLSRGVSLECHLPGYRVCFRVLRDSEGTWYLTELTTVRTSEVSLS